MLLNTSILLFAKSSFAVKEPSAKTPFHSLIFSSATAGCPFEKGDCRMLRARPPPNDHCPQLPVWHLVGGTTWEMNTRWAGRTFLDVGWVIMVVWK